MSDLGGSEMAVRLIDARGLKDKRAVEMALEWFVADAGLTVVFLAMTPIAKQGPTAQRLRIKRTMGLLQGQCSVTFLDLDLITLTKEHIGEEEWILTDAGNVKAFAEMLAKFQERYLKRSTSRIPQGADAGRRDAQSVSCNPRASRSS